ncbi:MAG: glycosyltransferase, partial [Eubacteriales bacterium]
VSAASAFLFVAILAVVLMRVESVLYFKYNWFLYLYSLIAALFLLSRYLFGGLYRNVPVNPEFTPGVSIIIPCFNEEEWIKRTILSCINQDYPVDKLEVIVVDDCSNDTSWKQILEMQDRLRQEAERFKIAERLRVVRLPQNSGKRVALATGVDMAVNELVVFVDSDSFLEGKAIRNLVQPFQDPKMGGVTGRTDVENKYTNALTKLQTVRYYIAFRIMKAAESYFDSVTCLSGPLSCYRRDLVLKYKDDWLNQKFLGHPATFGDDRSLTNFIIQNYRATYQDNAICSTVVPSESKQFLHQQMRWKRSWLRESLRVAGFIWKKEPFMALFFYVGFIVPIAAPIVFIYNLIYIPIAHGVFPSTFLIGLFVMSLLLSFSHLIFQKSRIWLYGFVFCIFYELVLLWQMPVAWFTFAVSTWGTRDTPEDMKAKAKRKQLKLEKQKPKRQVSVVADNVNRTRRSGGIISTTGQPLATRSVHYATRQQQFGRRR